MTATYEKIATTTLGSANATITFSSIPATYTDLVLAMAIGTSNQDGIKIMINNDTATNYSNTRLYGNGSSISSNRRSSTATVYLDDGVAFSTGAGSNNSILQFMNYSNTTTYKTWLQRGNNAANGTVAVVGLYRSTSAISRLDFTAVGTSTFVSGSTFTLYGIKAE